MAQKGDTVRYLNEKGGGKITRIEGKIAYVEEENGFEMPVLLKDVVVVAPAGMDDKSGASLIFDQKAYDKGKEPQRSKEIVEKNVQPEPESKEPDLPLQETDHGDRLNLVLAFEPSDLRHLDKSSFTAVLVNDSNYTLSFCFCSRSGLGNLWTPRYCGTVQPNEVIDLALIEGEDLNEWDRVALQYIAYRADKPFELKSPGSMGRRLDLTKFYKLHCFREGMYFDTPVLEVPLVTDDVPARMLNLIPEAVTVDDNPRNTDKRDREMAARLKEKYHVDKKRPEKGKRRDKAEIDAANPNKLLPLIEVDLHIGALTDTTAGMSNSDMMTMQLDTVTRVMEENRRRAGQKIVFIHGKGDGVLRRAVLDLLRRKYPACELQDASFAEYGFGATLVTVHRNAEQAKPSRQ